MARMADERRVQGTVAHGFETVEAVFADVLAGQAVLADGSGGTGAALAVWRRGEWIVDLWGGWADAAHTRPWQRDTIVMPYSVTKPFAAMCALVLADRGTIDLDEPLTTYWPEMTAPTTMRQVLAHRSGHVVLDVDAPEAAFYDWDLMCRLLVEQPPAWEPGTQHGESALFYGHLVGEVVRRIDGRSLGTFLREEVCGPRGLDFQIGVLAEDLPRVADLTGYDEAFRRRGSAEGGDLLARALGNPPGALDPAVVNSHAWRTAEVPAVNGHGTARAVAGLYVALEEERLLSPDLLQQATSVVGSGVDRVVGGQRSWGLGFAVDEGGYGMGGVGGSFGWWSRDGDYAFAFLTGVIAEHDRGDRLENSVRACLDLPPV